MSKPTPPNTARQSEPAPSGRAESLLPADAPAPSLEVAEEVSLDQQSDSTRGIGAMPADTPGGKPSEAVAETLRPPAPEAPDAAPRTGPP